MVCKCAQVDGVDCNLVGLVYNMRGFYIIQPTPDVVISYVDPQSIRSSITCQGPDYSISATRQQKGLSSQLGDFA